MAKAIETLFRSGAYTEEMDEIRDIRASHFLVPKTQLIEYRREEGGRVEFKGGEMQSGLDLSDKNEALARLQEVSRLGEIKDHHEPVSAASSL